MTRRRDETFLLYYYEDFFEFKENNPTGLYCLSDSTVHILLSALRFSTWPTRWRIDRQDNDRAIDRVYWDTAKAWGELAQQEVLKDMSCDLEAAALTLANAIEAASNKTAIEALAVQVGRLAEAQCCSDLQIDVQGGFQGTITQGSGEVIPVYGSEPPIGLEPETFPENYETLEAYNADKCILSNQMIDALDIVLYRVAQFGTFNALTAAGLILAATLGMFVFPPAAIPVVVSVLLILTGSLFLVAQVRASIIADRASWVCFLYEGENTEEIMSTIADALDVILAAIPVGGTLAWALKSLVMVLMNSNNLNKLFSGASPIPSEPYDCSDCDVEVCADCIQRHDGASEIIADLSVPTDGWLGMTSNNQGGYWQFYVRFTGPGSYKIEFQDMVGWTNYGGFNNFYVRDSAGAEVFNGATFVAFATFCETYCHEAGGFSAIEILSSTSFTWESRFSYCE